MMVSKKPRKQRLARYLAPHHIRRKFLSAPLSQDLRKKHGKRSLPVRLGDRVRIMRGDFKRMEGEVTEVRPKSCTILVEAVSTTKVDGTQVQRPINPSNVTLLSLVEDRRRNRALERRSENV